MGLNVSVDATSEDRLAQLREEYTRGGLSRRDADPDPVVMLRRWLDDAIEAGLDDPTAMVVSTVSATGRPSSRLVLLKGLSADGLVFFTNYSSRKGEELAGQREVAVVFPWHPLQRQARVEGRASRLDDAASDAYFAGRPRESQLGAWASPQSEVVKDRATLEAKYAAAAERFADQAIPRPPFWGGYVIKPDTFEFWQGRRSRLHDRIRYRLVPTRPERPWMMERIAP